MGLRINTNVASLSAQRNLASSNRAQEKSFRRLASGERITNAGDDAAGLSISENLKAQIRSINQADRNTNDGISFVQVAEGGMGEISNILVRLRELSIQAASDTIGDRERGFVQEEVESLVQEVDRISNVTSFNGTPLLNGQAGRDLQIQVGIEGTESDRILFDPDAHNVSVDTLGMSGVNLTSIEDARGSLETIDEALSTVNASRARLGAMQNKLYSTTNTLKIARDNLSEARSRIADTDIALESSNLVQQRILQTAGVAVLGQANQNPELALSLL